MYFQQNRDPYEASVEMKDSDQPSALSQKSLLQISN